MNQQHVLIFYQVVVFLFAISVHESAHAWTAFRCGDPTAYMLGRVTLNPIKHIDPIGTVVLPIICALTGFPMIGWAKPTPVNTRNFKNVVRDDILTSVAGPVSNFLVALCAIIVMGILCLFSPLARELVRYSVFTGGSGLFGTGSVLLPIILLLYWLMFMNVLLAVFNLIPVPPLDGSHVLRHFLSENARRIYDYLGIFGLIALMLVGGRFLAAVFNPFLALFNALLLKIS
jgi:Zn-dependent protease